MRCLKGGPGSSGCGEAPVESGEGASGGGRCASGGGASRGVGVPGDKVKELGCLGITEGLGFLEIRKGLG